MKTIYSLLLLIASILIFNCQNTTTFDKTTANVKVAWYTDDETDYEIFLWNGSTITQLTDNDYDDIYPVISGNNVVWMGDDDGTYSEIFFWNGSTITQLTDNNYGDYDPQISGSIVIEQIERYGKEEKKISEMRIPLENAPDKIKDLINE